MPNLVFYAIGGCVAVVLVAVTVNYLANYVIKHLIERSLLHFQARLNQETANALAGFKAEVCEQMALQERKTESLAKLYSALIDLVRDGKKFIGSLAEGEPLRTEKGLRTFGEAAGSLNEQIGKQSLHFSDDYKTLMEGFCRELEKLIQLFEKYWKLSSSASPERKEDNESIRQAWAKFEDRAAVIMELTRNEFRGRTQSPENVMKKWFGETAIKAVD